MGEALSQTTQRFKASPTVIWSLWKPLDFTHRWQQLSGLAMKITGFQGVTLSSRRMTWWPSTQFSCTRTPGIGLILTASTPTTGPQRGRAKGLLMLSKLLDKVLVPAWEC